MRIGVRPVRLGSDAKGAERRSRGGTLRNVAQQVEALRLSFAWCRVSAKSNSMGSRRRRKVFAKLREALGDNCHWCGKPMCFETKVEPFSASIEHLIPRSEGGVNERSNLRLTHRRCNEDRSVPAPKRTRSPFYVLAAARGETHSGQGNSTEQSHNRSSLTGTGAQ